MVRISYCLILSWSRARVFALNVCMLICLSVLDYVPFWDCECNTIFHHHTGSIVLI